MPHKHTHGREKSTLTYSIAEKGGGDLGEGTGTTKPEALLHLYTLARRDRPFARRVTGVRLTSDGQSLLFRGPGPFPANVDGVRFQRVA